jgi:hypothetical protein
VGFRASARTSLLGCPLSHVWVSIFLLFFFSISHYYLSRSLYISLSSLRVCPRMSLQ